ncbi:MAG: MaoC/PaaZ C-terminal domain-containing protein [Dehalococcoidales bacterium]|nr:MaoC/PaaZ C-terminal domain-containing protein [Dehalococcoidales bacterium]
MAKQVYFEDVNIGSEIPTLVKHPTPRQLVKWAGASGDYYEIHYDKDFALNNKLPGTIVHGWLHLSFLGQMMTDWIGEKGTLVKLGASYRGMLRPHEDLFCKGKVTKKYTAAGKNYIEAEIWVENPSGEKTTPGAATVTLPARK